jgi:serine protease Do
MNNKNNLYTNAPKSKQKNLAILVILLAFVFGMAGGLFGNRLFVDRLTSLDTTTGQQKIISSQSDLIASISKTMSKSVVSINIKGTEPNNSLFSLLQGEEEQQTESAGTGIILSSDGVIVTNKHVVGANSTSITVTTSDGKKYENVEILARDPRANYDIAFLKIKGVNDLVPAKIGDSSKMQIGDSVLAIGYALGEFQNTVTSGIISGLGRPIVAGSNSGSAESLNNLLQTDAAMNPGNSGGPLVNMSGEVIGINTAIAGNAQNIGFSIPINDVKNQITSILSKGKLEVPYFGVRYIMLNPTLKQAYDLNTDKGAWLKTTNQKSAVINGSPADKAGLKENDIIVSINNQALDETNTLASVMGKYKVGDTVSVTYLRDGKEYTAKATLEVAPSEL